MSIQTKDSSQNICERLRQIYINYAGLGDINRVPNFRIQLFSYRSVPAMWDSVPEATTVLALRYPSGSSILDRFRTPPPLDTEDGKVLDRRTLKLSGISKSTLSRLEFVIVLWSACLAGGWTHLGWCWMNTSGLIKSGDLLGLLSYCRKEFNKFQTLKSHNFWNTLDEIYKKFKNGKPGIKTFPWCYWVTHVHYLRQFGHGV